MLIEKMYIFDKIEDLFKRLKDMKCGFCEEEIRLYYRESFTADLFNFGVTSVE